MVRKFALFQISKNSPYFLRTVSFALFFGTPRISNINRWVFLHPPYIIWFTKLLTQTADKWIFALWSESKFINVPFRLMTNFFRILRSALFFASIQKGVSSNKVSLLLEIDWTGNNTKWKQKETNRRNMYSNHSQVDAISKWIMHVPFLLGGRRPMVPSA